MMDPTAKYKSKRKFNDTPEPEGKKVKGGNRYRFVIQLHYAKKAGDHYDLRLENDDGALSSWSIPKHRLPKGKEKLLAIETEDHPVEYLKFKGEIPSGYGAGIVEIRDSGTYDEIERSATKILFRLKGKKEKGTYRLFRAGKDKKWLIMEGAGDKEASVLFPLSKCAKKHTGAMLAIMAPPDIVRKMRKAGIVEDRDISDCLHLTLLYLGPSTQLNKTTLNAIKKAAEKVCARHSPLKMRIAGAGLFTPEDEGTPIYVVPNAKGLSILQADLENVIGSIIDLPSEHGWVPHMTVGYSCDDKPELPDLTEELEWTADKVRLQAGGEKVADIPIGSRKRASVPPPMSRRADDPVYRGRFTFTPSEPSHQLGQWEDYKLPGGGTQLAPKSEEELWKEHVYRRKEREEQARAVEEPKPETPQFPKQEEVPAEQKWTLLTGLGFHFGWYSSPEKAHAAYNIVVRKLAEAEKGLPSWLAGQELIDRIDTRDSQQFGRYSAFLKDDLPQSMEIARRHIFSAAVTTIHLLAPKGWEPSEDMIDSRATRHFNVPDMLQPADLPPSKTWTQVVGIQKKYGLEMLNKVAKWMRDGGNILKAVTASTAMPPLSKRAALERLPIAADPAMWTDEQLMEAVSRPELFGDDKEKFRLTVEQLSKRGLAKRIKPQDLGEWREHGWWLLMWAGIPLAFYNNNATASMVKRLLVEDFAKDGTQPMAARKLDPIHSRLRWQLDEAMDLGPAEDYKEADLRRGRAGTAVDELATHPFHAKRRKEFAERALNIAKAPQGFDPPKEAVPSGPRPTETNADAADAAITDMRFGEIKPEFVDPLVDSQEATRDAGDELVTDAAKRLIKRLEAERAGLDPEKLADDSWTDEDHEAEMALLTDDPLPLSQHAEIYQ